MKRNTFILSLITSIIIIIPISLFSQNYKWAIKLSGKNNIIVSAIASDNEGNVAVTGKFMNSIYFNDVVHLKAAVNQFDGFVAKYNSNGELLWAQEFGGTEEDAGINVSCDKEGNTYLAGYFRSSSFEFGAFMLSGEGIDKTFLAKISPHGKIEWARTVTNENSNATPVGIAVNNNQVFLSATYFNSDMQIDDKVFPLMGKTDIVYAMFSSVDGSLKWANVAGRVANDYAETVAVDKSGNCYLTGRAYGFFGDTINIGGNKIGTSNNYNSFITKFDYQGNYQWAKIVKGKGGCYFDGVDVSPSGDIFLCGYYGKGVHSIIDTSYLSTSESNHFITKISPDGSQQWIKIFQFGMLGRINGIAVDKNSNCFFGGFLGSKAVFDSITLKGASPELYKNFFVKLNSKGEVVLADIAGDNVNSRAVDMIAVDDYDNCFIGGYFNNKISVFGDFILENLGKTDGYIVKINTFIAPTETVIAVQDSIKEELAENITQKVEQNIIEDAVEIEKTKELEAEKQKEAKELKKAKELETLKQIKVEELSKTKEIEVEKQKEAEELRKEKELEIQKQKAAKELKRVKELEKAKEIEKLVMADAKVETKQDGQMVFPNPTKGIFYINLPAQTKSVIIKDSGGSFVYHSFDFYEKPAKIEVNIGGNIGTFYIEISTKDGRVIKKEVVKN